MTKQPRWEMGDGNTNGGSATDEPHSGSSIDTSSDGVIPSTTGGGFELPVQQASSLAFVSATALMLAFVV